MDKQGVPYLVLSVIFIVVSTLFLFEINKIEDKLSDVSERVFYLEGKTSV